jgi:hypothetical protein
MEEEFKSIKVGLDYYDENCVHSSKAMTIKVNRLKDTSENGIGWRKPSYEMTFSLTIPNHIHEYLKGKSVPSRGMTSRNTIKSYENLSKTINSDTIKAVCERYWEITQDYLWLKNVDKADLKKVIFYKFGNETKEYRSSWNGLEYGTQNTLDYKFCIGYISSSERNGVLRYNHNKEYVGESHDKGFYLNEYVDWTEERESFFNGIQSSFESIISKINSFKDSIKEEFIDHYIKSNNNRLLS